MNDTEIWRQRAEKTGFHVWQNKRLSEVTADEIKAAFDGLSEEYGIRYIWRIPE